MSKTGRMHRFLGTLLFFAGGIRVKPEIMYFTRPSARVGSNWLVAQESSSNVLYLKLIHRQRLVSSPCKTANPEVIKLTKLVPISLPLALAPPKPPLSNGDFFQGLAILQDRSKSAMGCVQLWNLSELILGFPAQGIPHEPNSNRTKSDSLYKNDHDLFERPSLQRNPPLMFIMWLAIWDWLCLMIFILNLMIQDQVANPSGEAGVVQKNPLSNGEHDHGTMALKSSCVLHRVTVKHSSLQSTWTSKNITPLNLGKDSVPKFVTSESLKSDRSTKKS